MVGTIAMKNLIQRRDFYILLDSFSLYGKIISKDNVPLGGMNIQAFDQDSIDPDDLLGQSTTDSNGIFKIDFDKSKFSKAWELLEGTPDVYLAINDSHRNHLLKTKVMQTQKEIDYHVKNNGEHDTPDPNAKDIYAGNARRLITMLRDVGNILSKDCLLYTSPSPRDTERSRMPSSA